MTTDKTSTAVREPYDAMGPVYAPNPPAARATLATVKHGGCVQLGDWLPPLPKAGYVTGGDFGHEAHNAFTPEQMRDYARAALSAQPSPGGQDASGLIQDLRAAVSLGRPLLHSDVDEIAAALAARQPVSAEDWSRSMAKKEAGQYVGAGAHGIPDEPAARQPVGEPVAWMTHHDEPMLYPTFVEAAAYCDDDEPPIPLYDAPPAQQSAQAVDLGPASIPDTPEVRDILGRPNFWCSPWANVLRMRGDAIPRKAEEEQAAVIRFMLNHYLAHGADWAEAAGAELDAIRKADSQAVGNG